MIDEVLKFVYPKRCVICDNVLPFGNKITDEFLCDECKDKLEFIKEPTCKKCGAMMYDNDEMHCVRCNANFHNSFEYGFGLLRYNNFIKKSIHRMKYKGRKEYIEFYGKCIAKMFSKKFSEMKLDLFLPVPIHKSRYRERNYNQAYELANAISKELLNYNMEIEVANDLVVRNKKTKVLNKLDEESRIQEIHNAFISCDMSNYENVCIVDDIYTTGTTIDALAKVIKESGVKRVYFVTIAVVDNL